MTRTFFREVSEQQLWGGDGLVEGEVTGGNGFETEPERSICRHGWFHGAAAFAIRASCHSLAMND